MGRLRGVVISLSPLGTLQDIDGAPAIFKLGGKYPAHTFTPLRSRIRPKGRTYRVASPDLHAPDIMGPWPHRLSTSGITSVPTAYLTTRRKSGRASNTPIGSSMHPKEGVAMGCDFHPRPAQPPRRQIPGHLRPTYADFRPVRARAPPITTEAVTGNSPPNGFVNNT